MEKLFATLSCTEEGDLFEALSNTSNHIEASNASLPHSALVITSDPQWAWTDRTDDGLPESTAEKEKRSTELIGAQYNSINEYGANSGLKVDVTINGDLTAFGHAGELSQFKALRNLLKYPSFLGLGNHDIENNFNDCWSFPSNNNACQSRMLLYMKDFFEDSGLIDKYHFYWNSLQGRGSWAYSYDLGPIYCIQLQNYPTMSSTTNQVAITPSLSTIESWMYAAHQKGKNIIVHVHKPNDWNGGPSQQFINMLKTYNVKAVFAGHYHKNCGQYFSYREYFGDVPVFLSGSASQQTYLIAEYNDFSMKIYRVSYNAWRSKTLISTIPLGTDWNKLLVGKDLTIFTRLNATKVVATSALKYAVIQSANRTNKSQYYTIVRSNSNDSYALRTYDRFGAGGYLGLWNQNDWINGTRPNLNEALWKLDFTRKNQTIQYNGNAVSWSQAQLAMDVTRSSTVDNTMVIAYPVTGNPNQDFHLFLKPQFYERMDGQGANLYEEETFSNWNDKISSVEIPPRMKLEFFEHTQLGGRKLEIFNPSYLHTRFANLYGFNNIISSYIIYYYYN